MAKIDTMKATTMPTIKIPISLPEKIASVLRSLMALPPNIAGIARKNVNSAATVRETPMRSEPMMVAPEREVPGKIAAINWNTPIINAVRYPIAEIERTRGTCP